MKDVVLHIGIDDTDSREKGMCTTYLAFLLVKEIEKRKLAKLIDYPWLIRLNPNIPIKTRGNGAVAIHLLCKLENIEEIKNLTISLIEKYAIFEDENTNPGLVIYQGEINSELKEFYWRAVKSVVNKKEVYELQNKYNFEIYEWKNGNGIIGALAAISADLIDFTFELIAYREIKDGKRKRKIDINSVIEMDKLTFPETFDNIDYETGTILITPNGPDPVFCGIRGENPEIVEKAFKLIKPLEPIEGYIIFKTNQATDHHLVRKKIKDVKKYDNVIITGKVASYPQILPGGHVKFVLEDETGKIDCIAYYEAGKKFREIVKNLVPGDIVEVYGSVSKYENTINLEKLKIIKLAKIYKEMNPLCPICGARMHSLGKNKGFKCRKCGYKDENLKKIKIEIPRKIIEGFYDVTPDARRHISKPIIRFGKEKYLKQ